MTAPGDGFNFMEVEKETALMRHAGNGDRAAFAEIIRTQQTRIWSVAYRFTQSASDADDIVQEAFLKLWKAAPTWEPAARLSTWLYRVVSNLCIDLHRKKVQTPALLEHDVAESYPSVSTALESQETIAGVQRAIAALPERQRMAVILHRFEGLSYQEIGRATGWGESAIESLLSRAYSTLRTQLADLHAPQ